MSFFRIATVLQRMERSVERKEDLVKDMGVLFASKQYAQLAGILGIPRALNCLRRFQLANWRS